MRQAGGLAHVRPTSSMCAGPSMPGGRQPSMCPSTAYVSSTYCIGMPASAVREPARLPYRRRTLAGALLVFLGSVQPHHSVAHDPCRPRSRVRHSRSLCGAIDALRGRAMGPRRRRGFVHYATREGALRLLDEGGPPKHAREGAGVGGGRRAIHFSLAAQHGGRLNGMYCDDMRRP